MGPEFQDALASGSKVTFCTVPIDRMSREDLVALVGWLHESNCWWRKYAARERSRS